MQERFWDWLCEENPIPHAQISCVPIPQIWRYNGACSWLLTARKGGLILQLCMSNPGKWLWFAHIGSPMKEQISGLHKSSSWSLIPAVLLTTPGGLMLSLLPCLWTYIAGRKKRLSLRHCVLYPTQVFTARFKISHTWFAFCQISFMWVEGKKTINLIYAHSQPL